MARNIDLLERTYVYTVEHQDQWEQGWWACPSFDSSGNICGTVCCFAGTALLVEGYQFRWSANKNLVVTAPTGERRRETATGRHPVSRIAAELLGLTAADAYRIFDGRNTLDGIRAIIDSRKAETAEEGS